MTRGQEINLIADCAVPDGKYKEFRDGIVWGAKWADKTMIDKVCKLIEENISYVYLHLGNYMEKEVDAKELSEWIRKALE